MLFKSSGPGGIISGQCSRGIQLKNNKITKTQLRVRLIKSIITGVLFFSFIFISFKYIQNGPTDTGTPNVLRRSFNMNAALWAKLSSSKHLSVKKPLPPKGQLPRVNGDLGMEDDLDLDNYRVTILSGDQKLVLPMASFKSTPKIGYSTDFRCIEGWSEEIQYAGARFSDFIKFFNIGKKADGTFYKYVALETPDKHYYVSIDMESMLHPQTVLAYEMNQEPLESENGQPLRLIIPIKYGIKNLKRIGKIYFSDTRPPDYWEERGYDWYSGL